MKLSINIEVERLNRGLSIRAAAKEIGVSVGVISRAEEGQAVHPASAKRIADFYGHKVSHIWPIDRAAA